MMPSQRRPPPPPPPEDDSLPPPLPNRSGPASPNSQPTSDATPPPLPNRQLPSGLGSRPTQRPASPQDEYLLPSEAPQLPAARCKTPEDEYLLPDQEEEPQEAYEEIGSVDHIARGSKTPKDDYEEMSAPTPLPFKPQGTAPSVQVVPVSSVKLPQLPLKPKLPQTKPKPSLEPSAEKRNSYKPKSPVRPWNSFRDLFPRSKEVRADDRKRKISAPAKPTVERFHEEENDEDLVYEDPVEAPAAGVNQQRGDDGNCLSDDDGWGSDFEDEATHEPRSPDVGGGTSPDADMYLTPDGSENSNEAVTTDDTYETPDSGFEAVPKPVSPRLPTEKPVVTERNTIPRDSPSQPLQSVLERMKMFQKPSETIDRSPAQPGKLKPTNINKGALNLLQNTPTKPNTPPKPSAPVGNRIPTAVVPPFQPPAVPKPGSTNTPPRPLPNPRPPKQTNAAPSLPPKPSEHNPPALPPNHPTRDSDDGGSAGSISSGSGGFNKPFKAELNQVIAGRNFGMSSPILRNAPDNQETVGIVNATVDEVYADGTSEDTEPLAAYPWFHSDATKENRLGDERVISVGLDGAFLVRKSSKKDAYTLIVYHGRKPYSLPINMRKDGKYAIGEEKPDEKRFDSVPDFIEHHQKYNINLSKGGTVTLTKHAPRPR